MTEEEFAEIEAEEEFTLSEEQKGFLVQKGLLFEQLLASDKFVTFFEMNYDIMQDEDKKALFLVEVPDEVAMDRAKGLMKEAVKDSSGIVAPSAAEIKKVSGH